MKSRNLLLILIFIAACASGGLAQTNGIANDGWGEVAWGRGTNGVCVGLQIDTHKEHPLVTNRIDLVIFLKNLTDCGLVFVVPAAASELKCALPDEKPELKFVIKDWRWNSPGGQIQLKKGMPRALAPIQKLRAGTPTTSLERVFLKPRETIYYRWANLAEYFDIRKPGRYQVQIDLRLQALGDDGALSVFELTSITTAVIERYYNPPSGCATNMPDFIHLPYEQAVEVVELEIGDFMYNAGKKACPEYITNLVHLIQHGQMSNGNRVQAIYLLGFVRPVLTNSIEVLIEDIDYVAEKFKPTSPRRRWTQYPVPIALAAMGKPVIDPVVHHLAMETNELRRSLLCDAFRPQGVLGQEGAVDLLKQRISGEADPLKRANLELALKLFEK